MATISLSTVSGTTLEELINSIEKQRKDIEYIMMNLDDDNITGVSGTKIGDGIDGTQIKNLIVDSINIRDAAITTAKIGTAQIGNAQIDRATVNKLIVAEADIANAAITNAKIKDLTIDGSAKIALASIGNAQLGTAIVQEANIADLSVTDAKIVELTANKLTAGTINTGEINITGPNGYLRILDNRMQVFDKTQAYERVSIGDVNGDGSIYGFRVRGADGKTVLYDETGVKTEGITDGSITNPKIGNGAVKDNNIFAGAVTADKIAAKAITADKMSVTSLSAITANIGTITAGTITGIDINGTNINGSTITGGVVRSSNTTDYFDPNFTRKASMSNGTVSSTANSILTDYGTAYLDGWRVYVDGAEGAAAWSSYRKAGNMQMTAAGLYAYDTGGNAGDSYIYCKKFGIGNGLSPHLEVFKWDTVNDSAITWSGMATLSWNAANTQMEMTTPSSRTTWRNMKVGTLYQASSIDYKKDLEEFNDSALDIVKGLTPTLYRMKEQDESEPKSLGLIAEYSPTIIKDSQGKGMNAYALSVVNSKAIKEMYQELTDLRNRVAQLEAS